MNEMKTALYSTPRILTPESEKIRSIGYNHDHNAMIIEWKDFTLCSYIPFTWEDTNNFQQAPSVDEYYQDHILPALRGKEVQMGIIFKQPKIDKDVSNNSQSTDSTPKV